jgi:hypothetical protein
LSAAGVQPGRKVRLTLSNLSSLADFEGRLLDLEISEDGGLRLFCGRASADLNSSYHRHGEESVFETLILGLTKRLILIAAAVAETTDYLGQWDLGIAITGLRGLVSWRLVQRGDTLTAAPFSEDGYRETARVTYERLANEPDSIVEDLTGRLNRALGGSAPVPHLPGEAPST